MDLGQRGTCNTCPNATCNVIKASNGSRYNWYCEQGKTMRMLDLSCPSKTQIITPDWCPKKKNNTQESTASPNINTLIESLTPMTKWEDIKINEIYRIPPICGWARRDILIKTKNQYSCTYVELKVGINSSSLPTKYLYPSSKEAKFIVPHRNMKMEMRSTK